MVTMIYLWGLVLIVIFLWVLFASTIFIPELKGKIFDGTNVDEVAFGIFAPMIVGLFWPVFVFAGLIILMGYLLSLVVKNLRIDNDGKGNQDAA